VSLTLAQLLTPKTEEQALDELLAFLTGLGFTASSWQPGSKARHIIQLMARLRSSFSNTTLLITKGRYNDTAEADWLTLKSSSDFNNTRAPAVAAQIRVRFDDPSGYGPFTVAASGLIVRDEDGATYRSIDALSLAENATNVQIRFNAEVAGAASSPSSVSLVTPLAGVDVSLFEIIRPGADPESDERLRERNRSKWSSLSQAAPGDAYRAWAMEASNSVTRVWVDDLNPRGPGTIDVIIAGVSGALPGGVATTVDSYINGGIDGIYRRPLSANLLVKNATNYTVNVTGVLYSHASYDLATIRTTVQNAVNAYISTVAVGGTVLLAELYRRIMAIDGVRNVVLSAPTSDLTVTAGQVPVGNTTLLSVH
jgi:uncharacterized phage protein gp47/JayE